MLVSNYCVAGVFRLCFHTAYARRPPFSGGGGFFRVGAVGLGTFGAFVDRLLTALAANGVVSSHHVLDCCVALMARGRFGARLASVFRIGSQAMGQHACPLRRSKQGTPS